MLEMFRLDDNYIGIIKDGTKVLLPDSEFSRAMKALSPAGCEFHGARRRPAPETESLHHLGPDALYRLARCNIQAGNIDEGLRYVDFLYDLMGDVEHELKRVNQELEDCQCELNYERHGWRAGL